MIVLLNITNVFMIFLFCVTFTLGLVDYKFLKSNKYCYIAILFLFFIADLTVISLTENVSSFKEMYDSSFLTVPTWKTLMYAGIFSCMILTIRDFFGKHWDKIAFVVLGMMICYMLFVPMMTNGPLKAWMYYEPNQFYMFAIGVLLWRQVKKHPEKFDGKEELEHFAQSIAGLLMCFAVIILIEDTYVIFWVDDYVGTIYICNRSFSEDIFRVILAIRCGLFLYKTLLSQFNVRYMRCMPEQVAIAEGKVEENISKFFLYSKEFQLTVREQEILELMLKGEKTQEIADELNISLGTAKTHTHNIFSKVGVSKRTLLIKNYNEFQTDSLK